MSAARKRAGNSASLSMAWNLAVLVMAANPSFRRVYRLRLCRHNAALMAGLFRSRCGFVSEDVGTKVGIRPHPAAKAETAGLGGLAAPSRFG
jgi:hypothetical protein